MQSYFSENLNSSQVHTYISLILLSKGDFHQLLYSCDFLDFCGKWVVPTSQNLSHTVSVEMPNILTLSAVLASTVSVCLLLGIKVLIVA